jgi:hypothetical protein
MKLNHIDLPVDDQVTARKFFDGFNLREEQELRSARERLVAAGAEMARPLARMGEAMTFQCKAPGALIVELGWWLR